MGQRLLSIGRIAVTLQRDAADVRAAAAAAGVNVVLTIDDVEHYDAADLAKLAGNAADAIEVEPGRFVLTVNFYPPKLAADDIEWLQRFAREAVEPKSPQLSVWLDNVAVREIDRRETIAGGGIAPDAEMPVFDIGMLDNAAVAAVLSGLWAAFPVALAAGRQVVAEPLMEMLNVAVPLAAYRLEKPSRLDTKPRRMKRPKALPAVASDTVSTADRA